MFRIIIYPSLSFLELSGIFTGLGEQPNTRIVADEKPIPSTSLLGSDEYHFGVEPVNLVAGRITATQAYIVNTKYKYEVVPKEGKREQGRGIGGQGSG
jgi:hypothetical protein